MKNEKKLYDPNFFRFFFVLTAIFKKWRTSAQNKHHISKDLGPKPWDMGFLSDSSISSRKIITMKMLQDLGHFGTKRVHELLT